MNLVRQISECRTVRSTELYRLADFKKDSFLQRRPMFKKLASGVVAAHRLDRRDYIRNTRSSAARRALAQTTDPAATSATSAPSASADAGAGALLSHSERLYVLSLIAKSSHAEEFVAHRRCILATLYLVCTWADQFTINTYTHTHTHTHTRTTHLLHPYSTTHPTTLTCALTSHTRIHTRGQLPGSFSPHSRFTA